MNGASRAYDWNRLKRELVVNDVLGGVPLVLVLASDGARFYAYRPPDAEITFALRGDSLVGAPFPLGDAPLTTLQASQEFWHSWRTFHPRTSRY